MALRKRISRDEYFMMVAQLTAKRSICLSRQVGAVIRSQDNRILSTGYNGPPKGHPHCVTCHREVSGSGLDNCFAIHAEPNAIVEALKLMGPNGLVGCVLYCTTRPCIFCLKLIIQSGIKDIMYIDDYPSTETRKAFIKENKVNESQFRF